LVATAAVFAAAGCKGFGGTPSTLDEELRPVDGTADGDTQPAPAPEGGSN